MKKRIISALLIAFSVIGCSCGAQNNADELRAKTAASTDNFSVSGTMMMYYYNDVYNTFVNYYGSYIEYLGLDTQKSLREQEADDGQSWYDYFMGGAKQVTEDILALNEAAASEGITLTDDEKEALRARVERIDEGLYGNGITKDDIYAAKLLEAVAYKYQFHKKAEFTPNTDELEAARDESKNEYCYVDYYSFPIYYSDNTANQKGTFTEAEAKAHAETLAKSRSKGEFERNVRKILLEEDPDTTENTITTQIDKLLTRGASYIEGNKVSEWAFGEDAKNGLILANPTETMYTAYMLTAAPYYDESGTVNVRHILLSEDSWGSKAAAKEKAEELFELFSESEGSVDEFALLVLEYSDDESTYYNGGRYENLAEGITEAAFNEWCFDPTRKAGDCEIIESNYGWHLMLYEGEGLAAWQIGAATSLTNEAMNDYLSGISGKYEVTFFDDVINSIPD